MNCSEAQHLFEEIWDLPAHHPQRLAFQDHLAGCRSCTYQFEVWKETRRLVHNVPPPVTEMQAERVNQKVMERIYAESPWLLPDEPRIHPFSASFRKHFSLWVAACLAVFLTSFIYMASVKPDLSAGPQPTVEETGIFPTGIAGSTSTEGSRLKYVLPQSSKDEGIMEPLLMNMDPSYPGYWMVLSLFAVALALFSLRSMYRYARKRIKKAHI